MIIGKNTLTLLIFVGGAVLVVNGVNWVAGELFNTELPFGLTCVISILIGMAIIIPWVVLAEKAKRYSETSRKERDRVKTKCSKCGSELVHNQFGPYCEKCKRYE